MIVWQTIDRISLSLAKWLESRKILTPFIAAGVVAVSVPLGGLVDAALGSVEIGVIPTDRRSGSVQFSECELSSPLLSYRIELSREPAAVGETLIIELSITSRDPSITENVDYNYSFKQVEGRENITGYSQTPTREFTPTETGHLVIFVFARDSDRGHAIGCERRELRVE